ncbi:hypothetical protein C4K35_2130 [Pseudomonas chlororaphis subsp. piscium]|nr:hypothetical protein C4K35_2130 [Pseudomonas chlororaphis subsp. piscium]AZC56304.1 hypothetical protein C4K34_2129 [Pseudomonas chlororaphis subsp. piscium]AZC62515.1 hypothetical protein C4K33_2013 [Pseudomonas chlororaphis subsp. piscium]AZC68752.1 hypothetical protein C4K32_2080 [Pseudomonas chlororaphis subsp. piscium]AZC74940.1 hypothetical protein C4K31_2027 [Pseudomonas chlororaphis subsp. piscium]
MDRALKEGLLWRGAFTRAGFRFGLRRRRSGQDSAAQSGGWISARQARAAAASGPRRVRAQLWGSGVGREGEGEQHAAAASIDRAVGLRHREGLRWAHREKAVMGLCGEKHES